MSKQKTVSLVKNDTRIRTALQKRFDELGLQYLDVHKDAEIFGCTMQYTGLTRYFKGESKYDRDWLTEFQILWLCSRYCINVELILKVNKYNNKQGIINIS